ncbi:hypothetical protein [Fictibacillus terranigra]|uniref:Uncharacterized protein n=1 Tax=Fictibacillus terranigra TaxID=3058424 RepID=A0ABT8E319_9BACL|nr:hypothetical protein [Fictibacillus sp. CENA-BCM004]MDN4072281.1 hypothetical protein [Fictibacillus sp. CENA-BCM004]
MFKQKYSAALLVLIIVLLTMPIHSAASGEFPFTVYPVPDKGKIMRWTKVDKLLPKGSKFKVIDLETGFYFSVQRRAGNKHADVQPLTYKDTAVLKHLYNGKWSWRRRAILIPVKGKMLAASMHGMPHGHGALQNGFPGHFCIHFAGSTTHRTRNADPSHKMMILKAGGKLDDYAHHANPHEVAEMYLLSLKENDTDLMKPVLPEKGRVRMNLLKSARGITAIHYDIRGKKSHKHLAVKTVVPVKAIIYRKNEGAEKVKLNITIVRLSPWSSWKISEVEKGQ